MAGVEEKLSASEAVYGFAAWLTTRSKRVVASGVDDASVWAELAAEFCKVNGLEEPRRYWTDFLTHPDDGPWGEAIELDEGPVSSKDYFNAEA